MRRIILAAVLAACTAPNDRPALIDEADPRPKCAWPPAPECGEGCHRYRLETRDGRFAGAAWVTEDWSVVVETYPGTQTPHLVSTPDYLDRCYQDGALAYSMDRHWTGPGTCYGVDGREWECDAPPAEWGEGVPRPDEVLEIEL